MFLLLFQERLWTLSKEKVEEEGECEDGTQVRPSYVKKTIFDLSFTIRLFSFPASRHFAKEIREFSFLYKVLNAST
jgi:hypothetical protein